MVIDSVILYETEKVEDLYPFSIMHCGFEVRCGAFRIFEKIQKCFQNSRLIFKGRNEHISSFLARFKHDDQTIKNENLLLIKSAVLFSQNLFKQINEHINKENNKSPKILFFFANSLTFAIYIPKEAINSTDIFHQPFFENVSKQFEKVSLKIEIQNVPEINYLWDAIEFNGSEIEKDSFYFLNPKEEHNYKFPSVTFIHAENIFTSNTCKIAPNVVIDASEGSVIIADGVNIMPNSVIFGPCFIGENTIIKIGAKIYGKTSFGEVCKIGGEVENAIVHAYTNKQHDGYLGHSYLGEWVNLGADTNTSDLKNTYGEIKVYLRDKEINSNRMFLGLICGDHTKSGINTMFTTGTVTGIAGILVKEWFLPASIPSFSWGGGKNSPLYKLNKAIDVARTVMARRNRILSEEEIQLMTLEYNKLKF